MPKQGGEETYNPDSERTSLTSQLSESSTLTTQPRLPTTRGRGPQSRPVAVNSRTGKKLSWQKGSLGEEIESFLGEKSTSFGWRRAYLNWIRFNHTFTDSNCSIEFKSCLSLSQINSYRLLLEWWHGGCGNRSLSTTTIETLKIVAGFDDTEIQDSANTITNKPIDDMLSTLPNESEYHNRLFNLFKAEFYWDLSPNEVPITRIQSRRRTAAIIAACQRLAYSFHPNPSENQVIQVAAAGNETIPQPHE